MKRRSVIVYIQDVLDSIQRAEGYLEGMSIEGFRTDRKTFDAVVRNIEVVGEAIKRVPESVTSKYPDIAWHKAAGMRDVLIHDYPDIVIDIVYATVKEHFPILREQMLEVKKDLETDIAE